MKIPIKAMLKGLLRSLWIVLLSGSCLLAYHLIVKPVTTAKVEAQRQTLINTFSDAMTKEQSQRSSAINDALSRVGR